VLCSRQTRSPAENPPIGEQPCEPDFFTALPTLAAGWWGMKGEYPAWEAVLKTKTTLPARMDAILFPMDPGQSDYPSAERLVSDTNTTALRVHGEGIDDTFILCEEGAGKVTVGDIEFEGRAVLVRREPELAAYAVSARKLTVAGEAIQPETA